MKAEHKKTALSILFIIIAASIILWQFYNLFILDEGSFHGLFTDENGKKQLAETGLIFIALVIINAMKWKIKYVLNLIILAVFSYLHQSVFSVFAAVFYFMIIFITGLLITRLIIRRDEIKISAVLVLSICLGICFEILIVAFLSILNQYSVRHIWYVLLTVSGVSIIYNRTFLARVLKKTSDEINEAGGVYSRIFLVMSGLCSFLMFAQVESRGDYDGCWYGLRSASVLAASPKGIYEDLKLIGFTYLYPKGMEITLLPLIRFKSWGCQFVFCFMLAVAIAITVYFLVKEIFNNKSIAMIIAGLLLSIPALLNMTFTVKPDIAAALFQVAGIYFMYMFHKHEKSQYFYSSLAVLLVSYCFKLTTILFTTVLLVALIGFIPFRKIRINSGIFILFMGIITFILAWGRTYYLTGSPIISDIGGVLDLLKVSFKYPYVRMTGLYSENADMSVWSKMIKYLYAYFVLPDDTQFYHVIIAWGTALPVILAGVAFLAAVFNKKLNRKNIKWLWFFTVLALSMLFAITKIGQADGNYFLLFYIIFTAIPGGFILKYHKSFISILMISFVYNTLILLCINWGGNVIFTPIAVRNAGYIDHRGLNDAAFKEKVGENVYDAIENSGSKVLAVTWDIADMVSIHRPSEIVLDIYRSDLSIMEDESKLYRYLSKCDIRTVYLNPRGQVIEGIDMTALCSLIQDGAVEDILYSESGAVLTIARERDTGNKEKYSVMKDELINYVNHINGVE